MSLPGVVAVGGWLMLQQYLTVIWTPKNTIGIQAIVIASLTRNPSSHTPVRKVAGLMFVWGLPLSVEASLLS